MFSVETYEVSSQYINKLCKNKELPLDSLEEHEYSGSFANLTSEDTNQSVLVNIVEGKVLRYVDTKDLHFQGWKPRDREQSCYFWSLKNKQATFCFGAAGTGKTSIALAYGIHRVFKSKSPLILCKPTIFVGKKSNAIAAVPGDERDKLRPYVDSYMPGFKKILGRSAEQFIYEWEENELLEFRAIELMRGQHFENCTLIIDEAQNLSLHELTSVLSRVDETSKVIILGDPAQIDTEERWADTGLYLVASSYAAGESDLTSMVKLKKQYRGPMAALCQDILEEYHTIDEEVL
tara:strand:+ start:7321 stop:8196 length:876 start_codon:yes stop_codon:yes gene_type:complete